MQKGDMIEAECAKDIQLPELAEPMIASFESKELTAETVFTAECCPSGP